MATPVASSYTVAAGQPIFAGRSRVGFGVGATLGALLAGGSLVPNASAFGTGAALGAVAASGSLAGYVLPTWLSGSSTFDWIDIPNSTMAGSPAGLGSSPGNTSSAACTLTAYSGVSVKDAEILLIATGGHNNSSDNGVRGIDLAANSPAWVLRKASDWNGSEANVQYYASGSPASAHRHRSTHWITQRSRMMLFAQRASAGGSANTYFNTEGFSLSTNAWVTPGTFTNAQSMIGCYDPVGGKGYGSGGGGQFYVWTESTDTHTQTATGWDYMPTMAFDSTRSQVFCMVWGDGEAGGSGTKAYKINAAGTSRTAITLTGAGATAFSSAAPSYGTMVYDPVVDCFWWWEGVSRQLFKIVPDGTTSWVCTVQSITGTLPVVRDNDFSRMEYVAPLKGLAFLQSAAYSMKFVRTA